MGSANLGLLWNWDLGKELWRKARASAYTELSLGHWRVDDSGGSAHSTNTQFGVTATLRLTSDGSWGFFGEAGLGANFIVPIYRSIDKRFSTVFNFGEHIGVGMRPWGAQGAEFSLRGQHFSNAGISIRTRARTSCS